MEHICFELQLCIEILIFKDKSNFWYTDHPEKPALSGQPDNNELKSIFTKSSAGFGRT